MGATVQGTAGYFDHHSVQPNHLGKTQWKVSPVGFGTYRTGLADSDHRSALKLALEGGCNLIDTSTNYVDGDAERLVGEVLRELIQEKKIKREEIVVVTKAGYIQGQNLEAAKKRQESGEPYPEIVEYNPDCWHCMSPKFLEDQLTASLDRLGLKQIDVLLLHNPEYFLKVYPDHAEYYRRIKEAFAYLETEVKKGRIQYYGVSSNAFPESRESSEFTSLQVLRDLALEVSPEPHFAVIELPMNLFEIGAIYEQNNDSMPVVEFARKNELGVLINRPLNAYRKEKLIRLADFDEHSDEDIVGHFKGALAELFDVESKYPAEDLIPARQICWGHIIKQNFTKLNDLETWKQALQYQIRPSIERGLEKLAEFPEFEDWARQFAEKSEEFFYAMGVYLESQAADASDEIAQRILTFCPELHHSANLSQMVIRLYRSIPGISSVLVGMREPRYVKNAMMMDPPVAAERAQATMLKVNASE